MFDKLILLKKCLDDVGLPSCFIRLVVNTYLKLVQ